MLAEFIVHDRLMTMLLLNGMILSDSKHKPWKLRTSRKQYFGMGAFKMVRATAYRQTGGHQALALAVVDDVMLGMRMKMHGFHPDALLGDGAVIIEWYRNVREMTRGMEKIVLQCSTTNGPNWSRSPC